ncbi:MAG: CapA family protein, partial [Lachnospiraceae bacterium]|nr:CapA family protein [Lachnospiraceae bacterium]
LVFTGDIGFDRYMNRRWEDPGFLAPELVDFCRSADHVVANVEGALAEASDDGSRGVFFHCMDPEATCILEQIRADIWNISNNHIMDAGREGLENTLRVAADMGCRTIGAGIHEVQASEPVYLEEAGGLGMFGVAYMTECVPASATEPGVFRWDDEAYIAERIREVKSRCRWCIVVAHGGEEFADMPNPYTRERYIRYLNMGADVVVAHHPHVPENYETFPGGKAIFYSLGNFIFDTDYQRAHPYTDVGVLLKLIFTPEAFTFEPMGTKIVRGREVLESGPVPGIFADVSPEEYEKLSPLAATVFLEEERKKMIYLEPDKYADASEEVWNRYFFSEDPDGYDKGKHMDLALIVPHAAKVSEGAWESSSLGQVKDYLFRKGL